MISTSGCVCTKKPCYLFVGLAQPFARLHRFGKPRIEIGGLRNAPAVRALPAEVRQTARLSRRPNNSKPAPASAPACTSLPPRAGKNHRMRKPLPRQHIAQAVNSFGVAVKSEKLILTFSLGGPRRTMV